MSQVALQLGTRALVGSAAADTRHRTARIIFLGALAFNAALTVFWLATFLRGGSLFYSDYRADWGTIGRILSGVLFFYVIWGIGDVNRKSVEGTVAALYSPRGTDDFTMGTTNALICWAFGAWLY